MVTGLEKNWCKKVLLLLKKSWSVKKICIDAQKHAVGFYKKFGFRVSSDDFLEEGIVHQKMELCTHFWKNDFKYSWIIPGRKNKWLKIQ